MVAKITNKVCRLGSLKLWSTITGIALAVALVLTFLPMQVSINTDGLISISFSRTQASSTGIKYPGTKTTQSVSPESGANWNLPANIGASDNAYATAAFTTYPQYTYRLKAQGFDFSTIPDGATIDGILVEIERKRDSGIYFTVEDYRVQLLDASGALVGDNKADTITNYPTSDAFKSYGGAADKWNASPTAAMVKDADFGVVLSTLCGFGPASIYVDCIRITVYYTFTATPEITNTPDSWAVGVIPVNTTSNTAINYFTITNTGNCAVDVTIQGTDVSGGDDTWDLADDANPGENTYGLYAGKDDADDLFDVIVRETATYNTLVSALAEDATQGWGLKIYMPTSVTNYDAQQMTGTITLVASAS